VWQRAGHLPGVADTNYRYPHRRRCRSSASFEEIVAAGPLDIIAGSAIEVILPNAKRVLDYSNSHDVMTHDFLLDEIAEAVGTTTLRVRDRTRRRLAVSACASAKFWIF
jgi:hypothetical protein